MNHIKTFKVDPLGKPRMTKKSAKFKVKWWAYKDEIKLQQGDFILPESDFRIVFYIKMPESWSEKKKKKMMNQRHQQKPDWDNLGKGLQDCLCDEDSHVWDARITKLWSDKGQIDIYETEDT